MRCRRGGHRPDSSSSASFKGVLLLWPLTSCNPGELLGSVVPLSPATLAGRGGSLRPHRRYTASAGRLMGTGWMLVDRSGDASVLLREHLCFLEAVAEHREEC